MIFIKSLGQKYMRLYADQTAERQKKVSIGTGNYIASPFRKCSFTEREFLKLQFRLFHSPSLKAHNIGRIPYCMLIQVVTKF